MPELQRLRADHAPAVLAFERENRGYFAASIPDRGDEFFDQFAERFGALLADQETGTCVFHVLVDDDGSILGRFNLVGVDGETAELGYRVAERAAGRGVATAAVRELCGLAAARYGLRALRAAATSGNLASQRVLAKAGFVPAGPAELNGKPGTWYRRDLTSRLRRGRVRRRRGCGCAGGAARKRRMPDVTGKVRRARVRHGRRDRAITSTTNVRWRMRDYARKGPAEPDVVDRERDGAAAARPGVPGERAVRLGDPADAGSLLLRLQRERGNRYVQAVLGQACRSAAATSGPRAVIQPKLKVTAAGDRYEREADAIARQVMRGGPGNPGLAVHGPGLAVHRPGAGASGTEADPGLAAMASRPPGGGQALPAAVRAPLERAFGADFHHVRVHTDSAADTMNRVLNARAFTTGQNIFLRRGEFSPGSPSGQELLAHELAHVVQQNGGVISAPGVSAAPGAGLIQRRIGVELEFPINVDNFGILDQGVLDTLASNNRGKRLALFEKAKLDKDTTIFSRTVRDKFRNRIGYKITPDHQSRMRRLAGATPAQILCDNILEFSFTPPVEGRDEIALALDMIYDKVDEIDRLTNGLTKRAQLEGDFYVGPVNNYGQKPALLDTRANSLQVNFGVEAEKIPDLFLSYAESSELSQDHDLLEDYRQYLAKAAHIAADMELEIRENSFVEGPLLGLRGLFAIMALYSLAGVEEEFGGTIKNFTPLLLKTPMSALAERSLTGEERELYKDNKSAYLLEILSRTRGKGTALDALMVPGKKGIKAGVKVGDLITDLYKAPYIVTPKTVAPDKVGPFRVGSRKEARVTPGSRRKGPVFETRVSDGTFDRAAAKKRADEMFMRLTILHSVKDEHLMTQKGPSDKMLWELEYLERYK